MEGIVLQRGGGWLMYIKCKKVIMKNNLLKLIKHEVLVNFVNVFFFKFCKELLIKVY